MPPSGPAEAVLWDALAAYSAAGLTHDRMLQRLEEDLSIKFSKRTLQRRLASANLRAMRTEVTQGKRESLKACIAECHAQGFQVKETVNTIQAQYGQTVSVSFIKTVHRELGLQRRKDAIQLGLITPEEVAAILVKENDEAERDSGYRHLHTKLLSDHGFSIHWESVYQMLKAIDPEGIALRLKGKLKRRQYHVQGPNHIWASDGHDKLKPFGIAIYGIIDAWSRKILGMFVGTSNNNPKMIGVYYLQTVRSVGGFPRKTSTNHGSETVDMAMFQAALSHTHANVPLEEANKRHIFTSSPHNQKIECFWSQMMKQKIVRIRDEMRAGIAEEKYNPGNEKEKAVFLFLWIPLVQHLLDSHVAQYNMFRKRKNPQSHLPTGCSPNYCYGASLTAFGAPDGLTPVDNEAVEALLNSHYPDIGTMFEYLPAGFVARATAELGQLGFSERDVGLGNVWFIFEKLCASMEGLSL